MNEFELAHAELVGREREQRLLDGFLDVVGSRTATVIVHGEAGHGKTSRLRWLAERAGERGFGALWATGVEFEREVAFSGLAAVVRPLSGRTVELGDAQRRALEVAVGLETGDAPILTTYGATLSLLSLAAAPSPV